jgi:excisionase family DNA binding protein
MNKFKFMEQVDMTCNAPVKNDQPLANSTTNDQLMTPNQVAEFFKVSRRTVSNWTKEGKLNPWGFGGRRYFKRSEIMNSLVELKSGSHEG